MTDKKKILVLDDDDSFAADVKAVLPDYEVDIVCDIQTAANRMLCAQKAHDYVLVDCDLDHACTTGIDVIYAFKNENEHTLGPVSKYFGIHFSYVKEKYRDSCFVLCTSYKDESTASMAKKAGADGVILNKHENFATVGDFLARMR